MTLAQFQERLRHELLRRIQRGTLNAALLSRQTGIAPAHISNFLHNKRNLSQAAMDRVLRSQHIDISDLLLPSGNRGDQAFASPEEQPDCVPIVMPSSALSDPLIRPFAILAMMPLPARALRSMRADAPSYRLAWQRFVAVHIPKDDALPMDPVILPGALAVIDRHYCVPKAYRPARPTLFAIRLGNELVIRYVDLRAGKLVLRPHSLDFPVDFVEMEPGERLGHWIAGRVALVLNET